MAEGEGPIPPNPKSCEINVTFSPKFIGFNLLHGPVLPIVPRMRGPLQVPAGILFGTFGTRPGLAEASAKGFGTFRR
jgi:hypothetical protein